MKNFLKKFKGKPLNDDEVAIGMHYCFCNAKDLYEDAKLLRKNKRYSRVFGLLVLSLEELSKIPILLNTLLYSKDDSKKWNLFWKSFNTHSDKQIVWSFYGKNLEKYFNNNFFKDRYPPGLQPLLEKNKQLCFYVNFFDNNFIKPDDFAKNNMEWLKWITEFTEKRIKSFSNLHSSLDRSKLIVKYWREILDSFKRSESESDFVLSFKNIFKKYRHELKIMK